jgi:hypothetical protein
MGLLYFPVEQIVKAKIVMADVVESALPSCLVKLEKRGLSQCVEGSKLRFINFHTAQLHGFFKNDLINIPIASPSFTLDFGHAFSNLFPFQIINLVLKISEKCLSLQ